MGRCREVLGKLGFPARALQVIQSRVRSNAAGPGTEISRDGVKPLSGPVNAPKRLHSQILSDAAIANDADGPGVDFLLVLAKESLKGFEVARRKSFEQLHAPLSISTYWLCEQMVTYFVIGSYGHRKGAAVPPLRE